MRKREMEVMGSMLEKEAEKIENNPEYTKEHFFQIKAEMEMYEKEKCEGAIVRSRAQYAAKVLSESRGKKAEKKLYYRVGKWRRGKGNGFCINNRSSRIIL